MQEAAIQSVDKEQYITEFKNKNIDWINSIKQLPELERHAALEKLHKASDEFVYRKCLST